MLLRNFYNMLGVQILFGDVAMEKELFNDQSSFGDDSLLVKTYNDKTIRPYISAYQGARGGILDLFKWKNTMTYNEPGTSSPSTCCLCLGSGTTPVTFDDYNVANAIPSAKISKSNFSRKTPTIKNGVMIEEFGFVISNISDEILEVNELGIFNCTPGYPIPSGSDQLLNVLLYRDVFDSPIIIPSGDSVQYTHMVSFQMPRAPLVGTI